MIRTRRAVYRFCVSEMAPLIVGCPRTEVQPLAEYKQIPGDTDAIMRQNGYSPTVALYLSLKPITPPPTELEVEGLILP